MTFGSISLGSGAYCRDEVVTVSATPETECHFVRWSDGSNDNPRKVVVTGVIVLSAQFDIRQCHLTLSLLNDACGELSGEGIYEYGTLVTCVATPKSGYRFVSWSDGATKNPYNFEIFDDLALTAQFDEIPKEEEPGDDQAIHPATADVSATLVLDRGILCIRRGNHTYTLPGHLLK